MAKKTKKLTGDPSSVWSEGMPDWLSSLIGDDDERRNQLMQWIGDAFSQHTEGQKIKNAAALKELTGGRYLSQTQKEAILNPEDKATRLERVGFHGGFVVDDQGNRRWTNNYDEWVAGGKYRMKPVKSFGPKRNAVPDSVKSDVVVRAKKAKDYRGVKMRSDGGMDFVFGKPGLESRRKAAIRGAEALDSLKRTNEVFDLLDSNVAVDVQPDGSMTPKEGSLKDDGTPKKTVGDTVREGNSEGTFNYEGTVRDNQTKSVWDFFSGLFGAERAGRTMRERGWLDAAFGGSPVRQAAKGGKSR